MFLLAIICSIICCIGVPLNGIVIWLLGFQIKRNPFTVLILNLAIADFGLLIFLAIIFIYDCIIFTQPGIPLSVIVCLASIMYINGFFLLTVISIDRCVCVLFPIWHRCSRPKRLSSAVCAFLWICSVLLQGIPSILKYAFDYDISLSVCLIVPSVLCLPLITASTVVLFVKICLKPKQMKRGRLLVMILITLLCFLILTLPLHIYVFIHFSGSISWRQFHGLNNYLILGASLNSSVNPIIYYLVGRKNQAQTRESIKVIFQRVFGEGVAPESTEKATNRVSTPL
ncbi:mas-related G-protein coupled receptor member H-like [Erythrolamprus reginae]|uniref:mas-related G-protein coupled receptor member H-like n=1 Tax=Erythrolamprus reginae TaxID=121349 RepID=UPI00396C8C93